MPGSRGVRCSVLLGDSSREGEKTSMVLGIDKRWRGMFCKVRPCAILCRPLVPYSALVAAGAGKKFKGKRENQGGICLSMKAAPWTNSSFYPLRRVGAKKEKELRGMRYARGGGWNQKVKEEGTITRTFENELRGGGGGVFSTDRGT